MLGFSEAWAPASDEAKKAPEHRVLQGQQPHRLAVGRAIPWSGCVPAEPASVSPGEQKIAADGFPRQCQSGERTGKVIVVDGFQR